MPVLYDETETPFHSELVSFLNMCITSISFIGSESIPFLYIGSCV